MNIKHAKFIAFYRYNICLVCYKMANFVSFYRFFNEWTSLPTTIKQTMDVKKLDIKLAKLSSMRDLKARATAFSSGVSLSIWMLCFLIRCSMMNCESETDFPSSSVIHGDLPLGPMGFLKSRPKEEILLLSTVCPHLTLDW